MFQLEVKDLAKRFGRKLVFQNLNFTHSGGVLGIAGSNGSGKSTFLRTISYLTKPTKGLFEWTQDSKVIAPQSFKKCVGMAAPYLNLYSEFSALENCEFHASLKNLQIEASSLAEWTEICAIQFKLDQVYGSLSSGQQQRVKLLAAVVSNPSIILLDEAGTNLDENGHQAVKAIIEKSRSSGKLLVLASNDSDELDLCDRIIDISLK